MALIGWDIGGTKCAAVLGIKENGELRALRKESFATCTTWQETLQRLVDASLRLLDGQKADAVGISCGGPLDSKRGLVLSPPNLPGWDRVPVTQIA